MAAFLIGLMNFYTLGQKSISFFPLHSTLGSRSFSQNTLFSHSLQVSAADREENVLVKTRRVNK